MGSAAGNKQEGVPSYRDWQQISASESPQGCHLLCRYHQRLNLQGNNTLCLEETHCCFYAYASPFGDFTMLTRLPQNLGLQWSFASSTQAAAGTDTLYPASEFLFLALAENQLDKYSLFLHGYFDSWHGNEVAILFWILFNKQKKFYCLSGTL